jgi:hypothetical protein
MTECIYSQMRRRAGPDEPDTNKSLVGARHASPAAGQERSVVVGKCCTGLLVLSLAALALFGIAAPLHSQDRQAARLELGGVDAVPQIYVRLRLRTSDRQLFVPYCSQGESRQRFLCTLGTHLEVLAKPGWQPARPRSNLGGILGGAAPDRAEVAVIAPRTVASFDYMFSRLFFQVEPGQQLRVVVDAWPDVGTLRAGGPSIQLISPPFACP